MRLLYIMNISNYVNHRFIGTEIGTVFWQHDMSVSQDSFMGFVQLHYEETAITFRTKISIAYPVHEMSLSVSSCWHSWQINNGQTVVEIRPVGNGESLDCFNGNCVSYIQWFI